MPLTQLPEPLASPRPCLEKLVYITERERERFCFSPSSHPFWTCASSLRHRLYLSPGLPWESSLQDKHTRMHTHTRTVSASSLSSLPFPLPPAKPPSGGFQHSQHHERMQPQQHKRCTCFCAALTALCKSRYFGAFTTLWKCQEFDKFSHTFRLWKSRPPLFYCCFCLP